MVSFTVKKNPKIINQVFKTQTQKEVWSSCTSVERNRILLVQATEVMQCKFALLFN